MGPGLEKREYYAAVRRFEYGRFEKKVAIVRGCGDEWGAAFFDIV